jgi:predicted MPP superfamily phosphohydrolase
MKISYLSDLHSEGGLPKDPRSFNLPGGDVLLLAGDIVVIAGLIDTGQHYERYLDRGLGHPFHKQLASQFNKYDRVYAVCGNHEFYKGDITDKNLYERFTTEYKNFKILENESVELRPGLKLFGATLWTDYNHRNKTSMVMANMYMMDHRLITQDLKFGFSPEDAYSLHNHTRNILSETLKNSNDSWVIMTHHSPSIKGCDIKKWGDTPVNYAFHCNDMEDLIRENTDKIKFWVSGHTHDSFDYMIGNTRMLCNPKGYGNGSKTENKQFDINANFEV